MFADKYRKIKLLKILEMLQQDTDEQHPMTTSEICRHLMDMGIACDRRILASEIDILNELGYEIQSCQVSRAKGYYIADRSFSVPELRILIESQKYSKEDFWIFIISRINLNRLCPTKAN